jgi:hypothetical protein
VAFIATTALSSARASDTWVEKTIIAPEPSRESWAGAEAFGQVLSLYTGATLAPFGSLRQDGLRLRIVAGTSSYAYAGRRYVATVNDARTISFKGRSSFIEALAGYQWSLGSTTVKAFAGWTQTSHLITPFDVETLVQGRAGGAKGALEIWQDLAGLGFLAVDLGYAQPHGAHSERVRLGARVTEAWSLGPEVHRLGHAEGTTLRMGGFIRFEGPTQEGSLSVGSSAYERGEPQAYITAQWLARF